MASFQTGFFDASVAATDSQECSLTLVSTYTHSTLCTGQLHVDAETNARPFHPHTNATGDSDADDALFQTTAEFDRFIATACAQRQEETRVRQNAHLQRLQEEQLARQRERAATLAFEDQMAALTHARFQQMNALQLSTMANPAEFDSDDGSDNSDSVVTWGEEPSERAARERLLRH